MRIYELQENLEEYSGFYEVFETLDETFFNKYCYWKEIDLYKYQPVKFRLFRNYKGLKNFKKDIALKSGLMILSQKALEVFKPFIENKGQIIQIETDSKRKKFFGFYPNNCGYSLEIVNLKKTDWIQAEKGKMFYKFVFNNKYPKEDYLFTLNEALITIFVTEKFKDLVEKNDLKGLDFSKEVQIFD